MQPTQGREPVLWVLTGDPAAGKTTVAHEMALLVGCVPIDKDQVWRQLPSEMAYATRREVSYRVAESLASEMLALGFSVVLHGPYGIERVDPDWFGGLAHRLGATSAKLVHLTCQIEELLEREGRRRVIQDLVAWKSKRLSSPPPVSPHLLVDTTRVPARRTAETVLSMDKKG